MRIFLNRWQLSEGRTVVGWVRFYDGEAAPVEGVLLRIEGYEAIIQLSFGVSLKRMLSEQRRLIQLYPFLYERAPNDPKVD